MAPWEHRDAPYLDLGTAAPADPRGRHRSAIRLPARPHLYRHVRRPVYLRVREATPTPMGSFRPATANDVVYVPRDAGDITLADPAKFAALDPPHSRLSLALRGPARPSARAEQLPRSLGPRDRRPDCRSGSAWRTGAVLELTADLFNVLNFLDGDWGLVAPDLTRGRRARRPAAAAGRVRRLQTRRGRVWSAPGLRRQIDPEASLGESSSARTVFF